MTVSEEQSSTPTARLLDFVGAGEDSRDVPRFVTVALAFVAAVLVAASTASTIEAGYTAIATSTVAAVVLFVGTVVVFESGRRLGAGR